MVFSKVHARAHAQTWDSHRVSEGVGGLRRYLGMDGQLIILSAYAPDKTE